jgi:YVTN family beta-propeller protein
MAFTKCVKLCGIVLIAAFSLLLLMLLTNTQNAAAAPGPTDTILLDGISNPFMPVDVAVNSTTGLAYVVNQGAGHIWVISGTELVQTIDPSGGGCPSHIDYGDCLNSVNVNPFTGKVYVTQWYYDRLNIISGTALIGWVYGGQGTAGSVMHPKADTVYALDKWTDGVTVIQGDRDRVRVSASDPDAGCVNPVNGYAYIANTQANNVLVISDLILTATVPVGSRPNAAACTADGYVYVVNSGSNPATVSVITGTQVIATISVGQSTTSLGVDGYWGTRLSGSTNFVAINERTGYVYVSNWGSNSVSVISGTTRIAAITVGDRPNAIGVYTPTNTVYVANIGSNTVSVISDTEVITTVSVGVYPIALAVNTNNGYVYVANRDSDSVSIIQGTAVVATIGRLRPQALAVQGGRIYSANSDGTVSVIEGSSRLANIAVGDNPQAIIGDGTYLYIANTGSDSISIINETTPITTLMVGGEPHALVAYTPTNRTYVANFVSNTVSVLNNLAVDTTIAVDGGPSALAVDPTTGDIFVANALSNTVTVINGVSQVGNVAVGNNPQAVAFNPANGYAYVANTLSDTVSVLDGATLLATRPVSATPSAIAMHPDTGYVYVAARGDDVVNVMQGTNVVASIPVGDQPNSIAVDHNLGFVYVTCEGSDRVWVLSGTVSLDLDFSVGDRPVAVVVEPGSSEAYIANYGGVSLTRVRNLPPTVAGVTPNRAEVGQSITVTLSGSGYFLTPVVWLNDIQMQDVQRVSRTTLTARIPDTLSVGWYTVTVRTPDGLMGTKVNGFMVMHHVPTATAIMPDSFANYMTTTVCITGGGFISIPTGNVGNISLQNVTWLNPEVITAQIPPGLAPGRYQTIFYDNMEQGTGHWSPDPIWQLTSSDYHSADRAWRSELGDSMRGSLYLNVQLDLTTMPNPQLIFWEQRRGGWFAHAYVEISTDGGSLWHVLRDATSNTGWRQTTLDLSPYATSPTATLRFRVDSYFLNSTYWDIDDIYVGSMPGGLFITNPAPGSPTGYLTAPFTVTNRAYHFVFDSISSPQITGQPFTITMGAYDAFDFSAQNYTGAVILSATVPISPSSVGPFTDGDWSGQVQIYDAQADVVITATDATSSEISGHSGTFDVSTRPPNVTGISPTTFVNHITTMVQITAEQMLGTPTVSIGDLSFLDATRISTNVLSARVPLGLAPGRYQTLFFDNLEQNTGYWTPDSRWQLVSSVYHSANRAWFFDQYNNGSGYSLYLNPSLDLTSISAPQLSFWKRSSNVDSWDDVAVDISLDGGTSWYFLQGNTPTSSDWRQETVDLSAYASYSAVKLRIRINTFCYWLAIDDIHVGSMPNGLLVTNPGPGSPTGYLTTPFTITNEAHIFAFDQISNPQMVGKPFTITITAKDKFGYPAPGYNEMASLLASVPITPTSIGPFVNGTWSGQIILTAIHADTVITVTDTLSPTVSGVSEPFDVIDPDLTILDVYPSIITNDVTNTIYITGTSIVFTPTIRIGRETLTNITVVDTDTIAILVPPGLPPLIYSTILYENAERDDTILWQADPPWVRTTDSAHNALYSWQSIFTYAGNAALTLSDTLDLTAVPNPKLDFWQQLELESGDVALIEVSPEPDVWLPLHTFTASRPLWGHYQLDLSPWASHDALRIRFLLHNENSGDSSVRWSLDDIAVTSTGGGVALVNPDEWQYTDLWQGNFTVTNRAAQFDIELPRAEQVAVVPFSITITARDAFGYVVRNYDGSVTLAASAGDISPTVMSGFIDGRQEAAVQLDTVQDGVVITVTDAIARGSSVPFDVVNQERAAYLHLEEQLNLYDRFWVYSDGGAPTNHYGMSYMGAYTDVEMNASYTRTVHSGDTAIRVTYTAADKNTCWGGAAWLDPEHNWSGVSGGFHLRGAAELVFWARGERGGERIKFGLGEVNGSGDYIIATLSDQWERYTIPLNGLNLDRVVEGFYWVAHCFDNPHGATFYLDDIHYLYRSSNIAHVYRDQFSSSNLYIPTGWMGDFEHLQVDEGVPVPAYPDATATRFTYDGNSWSGVYYQWPPDNWGDDPGGHDLSGAVQLRFRVRGVQGGGRIEFGMGGTGIGSGKPYPDSTNKHTIFVAPTTYWQEYVIDLTGADLSRIAGGFYWSASRASNPEGVDFYLDDIHYVFDDEPWPHFIPSFVADTSQPDDKYFAGSAHVYDNALAILAFLARGTESDLRHARDIADAMIYAQNHDPDFTDGRLRNAYHAEVLGGSGGTVWYWNGPDADGNGEADGDAYGAGSHVGNMSWVILALARMYEETEETNYLDAAVQLGEWIYDHTYDDRFYGGYSGGYDGWWPVQTRNDWRSTEHNIDAYVAFATLYDITEETTWQERALHAEQFVRSMWFEKALEDGTPAGRFWTGTRGDFLVYGDWEDVITTTNSCQPIPIVTMLHNHYYPTRFGPGLANIQLNTDYTTTVHGGTNSIRLLYSPDSSDWAGLIALEGKHNWGTGGSGYYMVGARSLTVWMKGANGGETVVIGIGGVSSTTTTLPISTTLPGTYASALTQTVVLSAAWQPYTITVPFTNTLNMEQHIGGFFAYFDPTENPGGAEIFLDDIVYHFDDLEGEMLNYDVQVTDVNAWGLMALREPSTYGKTVDWIHWAFLVTDTVASHVISGFDFDIDKDGIWFEGTGQSILAFQMVGRDAWSTTILSDTVLAQEYAPRANREGIVAALDDCLTTNLGWFYYNRLHVAPTAWYIFAAREYNPYWGTSTRPSGPLPIIEFVTYAYPADHLVLQGSNFYTPTVRLETPLSGTLSLDVSAFTSTTLTVTLSAPLLPGGTYQVILTNYDAQQAQKEFAVDCMPPADTQISYSPLGFHTIAFTATTAGGYLPFTYYWNFGELPSLPLSGIAYGPFRDGQRPGGPLPDEAEIQQDLDILSHHTGHIRLYGAQEMTPDIVRIAAEKGISVTLGAWIGVYTSTNELEIASVISLTNHYSNVVAITVGNEQLLSHEISEAQLISYIQQVQRDVNIPVSTAETWDVWLAHPQLADAVDFLLVHIHPYWEGVPVEESVDRVAYRYAQLQAAYPDKPIIIGETGWPTGGDDYGAAHPGETEQQQFVEEFIAWAEANDVSYFYFDAFDEAWKCTPGPAVECHWGLYTTERQPKPAVVPGTITTIPIVIHPFAVPGDYTITLTVSNMCGRDVYSTEIAVHDVNRPPVLELIRNKSVDEGETLVFTATATDTDVPTNTLTFSLEAGAPSGASIDGDTGEFTWTPTEVQGPGVHSVTVRVTDDGTPPLTTAETIAITVTEVNVAPVLAFEPDRASHADRGSIVTYTHTLTNTGNAPDVFDLTHYSSQGWPVQYNTPVSVGAYQAATVVVSITVPADVLSGAVDSTIITATSQADGNVQASVADTTTVNAPGVTLAPDQSSSVAPGSTVTYALRITNTGDAADTFALMVGSTVFTTTVTPTSVGPLNVGTSQNVTVTVQIPANAPEGMTDRALITATSQGDPSKSATVTLTTTVSMHKVFLPLVLR